MKINPADYVFTFEAQGTTFQFEDIDSSYYTPEGSLIVGKDGVVRTYIAKEAIKRMQEFGESQKPSDLYAIVASIQAVRDSVLVETSEYAGKETFTIDDARHMFDQLASLFRDYFYFDFSNWDTVFQKSKSDPEMMEMVRLVEQYKNELRAYFDPIMFTDDGYYAVLLGHVSKVSGVSREELNWYREAEIYNLFDGMRVSPEDIAWRKKGYVFQKDDGIQVFSDIEAQEIMQSLATPASIAQTLSGKIAHAAGKDKVAGNVRLILRDYSDVSVLKESMRRMQEGEILVSQSTDPELLEAMKKATAIVTDVGGMLSHAAITARELNIPCVVGTERASKMLKDGQRVEIDLRTGEITMLHDPKA
ncbi:MAG: PEP-utilizing enzyme [Patescibacteria group bacterium]